MPPPTTSASRRGTIVSSGIAGVRRRRRRPGRPRSAAAPWPCAWRRRGRRRAPRRILRAARRHGTGTPSARSNSGVNVRRLHAPTTARVEPCFAHRRADDLQALGEAPEGDGPRDRHDAGQRRGVPQDVREVDHGTGDARPRTRRRTRRSAASGAHGGSSRPRRSGAAPWPPAGWQPGAPEERAHPRGRGAGLGDAVGDVGGAGGRAGHEDARADRCPRGRATACGGTRGVGREARGAREARRPRRRRSAPTESTTMPKRSSVDLPVLRGRPAAPGRGWRGLRAAPRAGSARAGCRARRRSGS